MKEQIHFTYGIGPFKISEQPVFSGGPVTKQDESGTLRSREKETEGIPCDYGGLAVTRMFAGAHGCSNNAVSL